MRAVTVYNKHDLLTLVDLGEWRNCIVQAWRPNGPLMRAVTVGKGSEKMLIHVFEKCMVFFCCCSFIVGI